MMPEQDAGWGEGCTAESEHSRWSGPGPMLVQAAAVGGSSDTLHYFTSFYPLSSMLGPRHGQILAALEDGRGPCENGVPL